ncbi:hypothetical protein Thicy_0933 [Thiomicrospira cyclica ALM1]|uniref:Uncharacterized protein n=1 Tax=Thiomicrospira cyclica (strain DSM 14477 / JCM 11371 / ALM1) TaxID=717773 RepID=F6DCW4_THICA|nr:hypothetical protein Thicy_0933 [Thiomicrospira cyclica ALM1]
MKLLTDSTQFVIWLYKLTKGLLAVKPLVTPIVVIAESYCSQTKAHTHFYLTSREVEACLLQYYYPVHVHEDQI